MNSWKTFSLNGEWDLIIADNKDFIQKNLDVSDYTQLNNNGFLCIPATVPGNFELDMFEAGLIEHPFFGENPLKMQDLENKHLFYRKKINYVSALEHTYLLFEGIDTFADIYLNGNLLASTDNMLLPHEIKADGLKSGENELIVHIKPTAIEARKFDISPASSTMKYNADSLYVRKAPHMFGWDIMPRILSGGIWRPVSIVQKPPERIEEIFFYTNQVNRQDHYAAAEMFFKVSVDCDSIKGYELVVSGTCKNSHFKNKLDLWYTSGKVGIRIENPELWWPNSLGDPNLYDVTVELFHNDILLDTYTFKTGIRKAELVRTSTTDKSGSGEFCFYINGEKLFVKGTNWVPADAFHSRDKKRLPEMLALLKDIGCNAVRCWGGNVYEDPLFYDFCDENGIIVWQDFAMGCAIYPQDELFSKAMSKEIAAIVKILRNHPSIVLWAGDNECDCSYAYWGPIKRDPNTNTITRKVIPDMLKICDHTRPYLPSSPYLDEEAFQKGNPPEDHLWGPRDYFKSTYYTTSDAHFASEIGYHGCNSPHSIEKFISKGKLWPWQHNTEWLVHATCPELSVPSPYSYRIELMAKQIKELFGVIPDNLEEFSMASQISQAEAFKFFIEFFRTAKWRRTGIIWWNLIDGWPQFSDAVVDYYYFKKLAYHFIKRSQQPICLMFSEPNNWAINLMASNDTLEEITISYTVKDISNNDCIVCSSTAILPPNSCKKINRLNYSMGEKHFYVIEWTYNGITAKNHYLSGTPPFDLNEYLGWLKQAELYLFEGF